MNSIQTSSQGRRQRRQVTPTVTFDTMVTGNKVNATAKLSDLTWKTASNEEAGVHCLQIANLDANTFAIRSNRKDRHFIVGSRAELTAFHAFLGTMLGAAASQSAQSA